MMKAIGSLWRRPASLKSPFGWKALVGAVALLLAPAFVPADDAADGPSARRRPLPVGAVFDSQWTWLARAHAQAGSVPRLEFASGCRDGAGGSTATQDRCMRDEEHARAKLATEWASFAHADRTSCTQLARLGGGLQSYVELLTCLEMAKEAKALPKQSRE